MRRKYGVGSLKSNTNEKVDNYEKDIKIRNCMKIRVTNY